MKLKFQGLWITHFLCIIALGAQVQPDSEELEEAMLRATRFMCEEVSHEGGFVWNYLPDLSRRWGEMEAFPEMIWFQPPGTPSMGQIFLDAFIVTGDSYYIQSARKLADALVAAQLDCGGWNYMTHTAGEEALRHWYETIGKNGWRLEEFRHYYGNASFDDDATYAPASFLLRFFQLSQDSAYLPPLLKVIDFVLESQYPVGGWPQRYPPPDHYPGQPHGDYPAYITLNDGVHRNNVLFLLACYSVFREERLMEAARRAMDCIIKLRQDLPQPGWSWQHSLDLVAAGGRSYEPEGIYSGATFHCIMLLMDYYQYTGDRRFLEDLEESIHFLESLALPQEIAAGYPRKLRAGQKVYPSCVEAGSNRPLFVHRRGSNTASGEYYSDYDHREQWMPTFSMRALDTGQLWDRLEQLASGPELIPALPVYAADELFFPAPVMAEAGQVKSILEELDHHPYWEAVFADSHPYAGEAPDLASPGDFATTQVGDRFDTSPFRFGEAVRGISTRAYIGNMTILIAYLQALSTRDHSR